MDLVFTCDECGNTFAVPNIVGGTGRVYMEDNRARCPAPHCGGWGQHKPGFYDFVDGVLKAFAAPGMTREKIEAAKKVIADASTGALASDEAIKQLSDISVQLGQLIEKSGQRKISWELILTIVPAIYTIWTDHKSDANAQAVLIESRTQTEVAQRILEETQAQSRSLRELTTKRALQPPVRAQTSVTKNRHERRKQEKLARAGRKGAPVK